MKMLCALPLLNSDGRGAPPPLQPHHCKISFVYVSTTQKSLFKVPSLTVTGKSLKDAGRKLKGGGFVL